MIAAFIARSVIHQSGRWEMHLICLYIVHLERLSTESFIIKRRQKDCCKLVGRIAQKPIGRLISRLLGQKWATKARSFFFCMAFQPIVRNGKKCRDKYRVFVRPSRLICWGWVRVQSHAFMGEKIIQRQMIVGTGYMIPTTLKN